MVSSIYFASGCQDRDPDHASLRETQALPSVYGFAEGLLSGTRQSWSVPRAAVGTGWLTAQPPLPTAGPSAPHDPRQDGFFAEG
jgi:hypothetical protein